MRGMADAPDPDRDRPAAGAAATTTATAVTTVVLHPAMIVVAAILGIWAIKAARGFLVPLVIALMLLAIVNALERTWSHVRIGGRRLPRLVTTTLSAILIASIGLFFVELLVDNINGVINAAPQYQTRLQALTEEWREKLQLGDLDVLDRGLDGFKPAALLGGLASGLAGVVGTTSLVIVYLTFLLMERGWLTAKLAAAFPADERRTRIGELIDRIDHDVSMYLALKALVSLLTAALSYIVLRIVGLDFAEFWAVLIFAFNFIPNVGSLVATVLPAVVALLQFETMREFVIVAVGVTAIQLVIANLVEPGLMGRRLNMSPLVVMLALVAWSMLWGIPGAFLSVPMTAVVLIVLGNIPATRWIAILLSQDGRIRSAESPASSGDA
jgi:predicted PurR-regulated permease PerM